MPKQIKIIIVAVIAAVIAVSSEAKTADSQKSISPELKTTLEAMTKLDGADIMAVASWLKGEGRAKLRDRGADDKVIGPARLDIDRFDDAPFGENK